MAHATSYKVNPPQAFMSSYAPRIRTYGNPLLTPVQPAPTQLPNVRTTKRGTTAINYAEDGYDDADFDDLDGPRRLTGLRTRPRDEHKLGDAGFGKELGKELNAPIAVQGIWRDWMGKTKRSMTERQLQIQNTLPLVLIPIRIDLTIHAFRPEPPLPTPNNSREFGIDETLPAYKQPDMTTDFRLRDSFLWNLHEALMTPDQFAKTFVDELDLPTDKKPAMAIQIADQIRVQLQEYAGVAMHPLFNPHSQSVGPGTSTSTKVNGTTARLARQTTHASSREHSRTPAPGAHTPQTNGVAVPSFFSGLNGTNKSGTQTPAEPSTPAPQGDPSASDKIVATATTLPEEDVHNADDTYRCIINLSINLSNRLFSDRFEWSLLHPPGLAEQFARQTCADLGLSGEWVAAMAHAIYEAVLKLRKEACENGGIVGATGGAVGGELDNDTADGKEAGWRYDPEHLGDEWEPKVEILSKEEIERREWDRERELRRLKRDIARFSSTAHIGSGGAPETPQEDQPMGRGERSKKKRRFRSLSPLGRDTPDVNAGYGGGTGKLEDNERTSWRCLHCRVWGQAVWSVRDGPKGNRTLCQNCGYVFERDKRLPPWSLNMFELERPYPTMR